MNFKSYRKNDNCNDTGKQGYDDLRKGSSHGQN
jgi:hypothetical protein